MVYILTDQLYDEATGDGPFARYAAGRGLKEIHSLGGAEIRMAFCGSYRGAVVTGKSV